MCKKTKKKIDNSIPYHKKIFFFCLELQPVCGFFLSLFLFLFSGGWGGGWGGGSDNGNAFEAAGREFLAPALPATPTM